MWNICDKIRLFSGWIWDVFGGYTVIMGCIKVFQVNVCSKAGLADSMEFSSLSLR